jgi:T4 RnlA family RNA ligase
MNKLYPRQAELYDNLMALADSADTFFFKDQELDGVTYRVFSYRIGSYQDWIKPDALECRGHTFRMEGGEPVSLVAWPMHKFFNVGEVTVSRLDEVRQQLQRLHDAGKLSLANLEKLLKELNDKLV